MTCAHDEFVVLGEVNRLTQVEGGPVTGYSLDLTVSCVQCDERFVFIGAQSGLSPRRPMVSANGQELRAPIRPASAPEGWGEDGPEVTVRALWAHDPRQN